MNSWNGWDAALLAAGIYLAAITLIRLMQFRRKELVDQFQAEVEVEKRRLAKRKKKQAAQQSR